ncbi:MAG TPA: hypothetical protein VF459_06580 [Caulobacteraceae bacterium]
MRKGLISGAAILALTTAVAMGFGGHAAGAQLYRMESATPLPGKSPSWDYLSFDAARSYLFLGRRADGVTVYDVRAHKVVATIADSKGANMATLVPEFDRGYTTNGDGSTTVFSLSTLKTITRIKLGDSADAAFFDPATRQLAFTMGDSHQLTFMDAATGAITGRLHMEAEELEGVAPDGKGSLYVVERDIGKVAKIDAAARAVVAEWPLPKCDLPTGVALDRANGRLFLGCKGEHPVLTVLDVANGAIVAQPEIGRGNDGVVFDPQTHRVFTSNGVDGNIVIFDQVTPNSYKLVQAVTTRPIARTMAIDPATKHIFTMTAEGMVDPAKPVNRRAGAFYPNTYFDDTFTLLEFAPHDLAPGKADEE